MGKEATYLHILEVYITRVGGCCHSRRSLPLMLMRTHVLMTYLSQGYLPCRKGYKIWFFFAIKVNAWILAHLINDYNIFGKSFKNTLFHLYCIFSLIPQVTKKKLSLPFIFFPRSPTVVHVFLTPPFVSYTPFCFWVM